MLKLVAMRLSVTVFRLLLFVLLTGLLSSASAVEYQYVGWASGGIDAQGGILLATTNGTDWFRQGIGQIPAVDLGGVCSAGSNVWVLGDVSNGYGVIAHSGDDGATWIRQGDAASIPALTLRKPWAVDENTVWVVGDSGTVLRTVNGGTTWSNVSLPTFTNALQGVTAVDGQRAWVSGSEGTNGYAGLFYTTDGGQHWTQSTQGAITNVLHVLGLYALDADRVWGLGGQETLIKSEDGGANWSRISGGTIKDGNELKMLDENHIWMAVDAQVQWTTNGGSSWEGRNTAEYTMDVDTPWGTNIWAVSSAYYGGIIYHSSDGGLTWTNQAQSNAWIGIFMVDMQMRQGPPAVYQDYDGDAKADVVVFWPEVGTWYILQSSDNQGRVQPWGWTNSYPVSGDYDGDGKYDVAVYNDSFGMWYILESETMTGRCQAWGAEGMLPVPADYDGDGITDIAVYERSSGSWLILQNGTGTARTQNWGWSETVPVPGDYDGDGKADCAVYNPEGGAWYILESSTGTARTQPWGWADAEACQGDFDGDGKTDVAVYWAETGWWNILQSSDGQARIQNWGWSDAIPVPADYDGDEKYDVTVYWPTEGFWYIWQSESWSSRIHPWGWNGADPVTPQYRLNSVE